MHWLTAAVAALGLASPVIAGPKLRRDDAIPIPGPPSPRYVSNATRANAVKSAFQTAWDGYYKYAFPHDSLLPISQGYADDRNGWGASAVDAFSTALVMGNWDVVNQILAFVPTIDFDNTPDEVSLFETTIRYLGGLLSAYDLLTGPLRPYARNQTQVTAIIRQAERLAKNLKVAFFTPSGVPDNSIFFEPKPHHGNSTTNGIATIGTLVLEWTRLSDITRNPEYAQLAQWGEHYLLNPRPASGEPFPGLIGQDVNITTGQFVDGNGGWVGGSDSFYEYLIKMYLYDPDRFDSYKDRWVLAVESSIKYLASHPTTRPDLTFLALYNGKTPRFISQHLACFDGGNFILGGLTLDEPRYTNFGLQLVNACHETYIQTTTGIGPETFQWQDNKTPLNASNNPGPPDNQTAFYNRAGFWFRDPEYVLRPEVIESFYYAYRATGDTKYQEWAWQAFLRINATCRAGVGYSSINDVNSKDAGGFQDFQESFWFAEVLKYSYLIHAEESDWQIKADHTNKFVFNTEAHPVRIASGFESTKRGKRT